MMSINTNIEDYFLKDIIYHPEDDRYKMVYADWLEDQGRIREAEEVRDPIIEYSTSVFTDSKYCKHNYYGGMFQKGKFIYRIELKQIIFIMFAKNLFNEHPITEIELIDTQPINLSIRNKKWFYTLLHIHTNIVKYMNGKIDIKSETINYTNEKEAVQNLENACLQYGRSLWNNK